MSDTMQGREFKISPGLQKAIDETCAAIRACFTDATLRTEAEAARAEEPTDEMLLAGARSIGHTMGKENHLVRAAECWRAMQDARNGIMTEPPARASQPVALGEGEG